MKHILLFLSLFYIISIVQSSIVTTNGRNIYVDGNLYIIHGVAYSSLAIGDNRWDSQDYTQIDTDIALMKGACINTIRTWGAIKDVSVLDKLAANGIKVIMGFPSYDDTYQNNPDITSGSYLTYINTYKNHDAILMWEFGNEYNYHPEWFSNNINNWYTMLNNAAEQAKLIDPNHPISTAHGDCPTTTVLNLCPNVDAWGMNVYRWDDPSAAITTFMSRSNKPCYFSEAGGDRFNNNEGVENQHDQAQANAAIWYNCSDMLSEGFSGINFMAWTDGWDKSAGTDYTQDNGGFSNGIPYDGYANEEWWGIVDIYRNTTLAYDTIRNIYCNSLLNSIENIDLISYQFNNPVINELFFFGTMPNSIEIYDIKGNLVIVKTKVDNYISLKELEQGFYFMRIFDENSSVCIKKVVKF